MRATVSGRAFCGQDAAPAVATDDGVDEPVADAGRHLSTIVLRVGGADVLGKRPPLLHGRSLLNPTSSAGLVQAANGNRVAVTTATDLHLY